MTNRAFERRSVRPSLCLGLGVSLFLSVGTASAAEPGLDAPVPYLERPLTLPEMTVAASLDLRLYNLSLGTGFGTFTTTLFSQSVGARFGVTDDFEVFASPLTFYAGDTSGYGTFQLGARYRLIAERPFEMAVGGSFYAASGQLDVVGMNFGVPMLIRGGDLLRVDTGIFWSAVFQDPIVNDPYFALANQGTGPYVVGALPMVPANFTFQAAKYVYLGVDTGFGIGDVDRTDTSIFVPFGFRLGGTIPVNQRPLLDIEGGFRFPAFFTNQPVIDPVGTELWEVQILKLTAYVDVMD